MMEIPQARPLPRQTAPWHEIWAWCMFDFANSSFTTLITTVVYAVYFVKLVAGGTPRANFLWSFATFVSQLAVLATAPLLGALADFSGAKKKFLTATYLFCVVFTASLYWVRPGDVLAGMLFFALANIGFSAGENFIASFLPELAAPQDTGKISGYGWGMGYLGGLVALALCYPFPRGGFEMENVAGLRQSFLVVAAFFAVAGLPALIFVRERARGSPPPAGSSYLRAGYRRVLKTMREAQRYRELMKFFAVFFCTTAGS